MANILEYDEVTGAAIRLNRSAHTPDYDGRTDVIAVADPDALANYPDWIATRPAGYEDIGGIQISTAPPAVGRSQAIIIA